MRRIGTDVERESGLECPVCTFLGGDGSVLLGWSSSGLALDSSWQNADIGWFRELTDGPMVTLLGFNTGHDFKSIELLAHRSFDRHTTQCNPASLLTGMWLVGFCFAQHGIDWLGLVAEHPTDGETRSSPIGRTSAALNFVALGPRYTCIELPPKLASSTTDGSSLQHWGYLERPSPMP
jgi:hypothetical protein